MNIYVLFLIVVPVVMFSSAYLVVWQFRSIPVLFEIVVKRKWLVSASMGIFFSGIFTLILLFDAKFSIQTIFEFVGMALIASLLHYFGLTLGERRVKASIDNLSSDNPSRETSLPENIIINETMDSVKIMIHTKKRWVWFVMEIFQLLVVGLCALPVLGMVVISLLQNFLSKSMNIPLWILVGGLVLYLIYLKFQEALEYIYDKEIIEIDALSVRIEKYGSRFKSIKEFPAENIKKITTLFPFAGKNMVVKRSPFINSNMPAFMLLHYRGLKRYRSFGRAVDLADAQRILETIYVRFPQYKG